MQDIKQQEDLLSRELDVLENAISDENRELAICSREEVWKKIDRLISLVVEQEKEKYKEIFEWLLGEKGDFPDLSQKPHYSFRTELRERLKGLINNK